MWSVLCRDPSFTQVLWKFLQQFLCSAVDRPTNQPSRLFSEELQTLCDESNLFASSGTFFANYLDVLIYLYRQMNNRTAVSDLMIKLARSVTHCSCPPPNNSPLMLPKRVTVSWVSSQHLSTYPENHTGTLTKSIHWFLNLKAQRLPWQRWNPNFSSDDRRFILRQHFATNGNQTLSLAYRTLKLLS